MNRWDYLAVIALGWTTSLSSVGIIQGYSQVSVFSSLFYYPVSPFSLVPFSILLFWFVREGQSKLGLFLSAFGAVFYDSSWTILALATNLYHPIVGLGTWLIWGSVLIVSIAFLRKRLRRTSLLFPWILLLFSALPTHFDLRLPFEASLCLLLYYFAKPSPLVQKSLTKGLYAPQ